MVALSRKLFRHLLPAVIRPLHILWNQVIGFMFIVLALVPVPSAYRAYHDPDGFPRLVMAVLFSAIMAIFGISSFLRARKIART